jgi:hypothetical protein
MKPILLCLLSLLASSVFALEQGKSQEEQQKLLDLWRMAHQPGHILLFQNVETNRVESDKTIDTEDCYKHLNLTDHGINQVMRYHQTLRHYDLKHTIVYSSQWCRTIETAARLGLGYVHTLALLNEEDNSSVTDALQTQALRAWILEQDINQVLVLVTHKTNVIDLSGIVPEPDHVVLMAIDERGYLVTLGTMPLIELSQ